MRQSLYIVLLSGLLIASSAFASEDVDPELLNQFMEAGAGNAASDSSSTGFMDEEDMDFSAVKDAFAGEDEGVTQRVPVLQRNSATQAASPKIITNEPAPENISIGRNTTLTDTLQKQEPEKLPTIPLPDVKGTWVDKLASSVPLPGKSSTESQDGEGEEDDDLPEIGSAEASLQNMVNSSRQTGGKQRSNASVFDISGIMLRMTPNQVEKAMLIRGFKKVSQAYDIPNFIRWRNEETCRGNGVVGYERINNCVVQIAKKNNHQYVSDIKYSKFATKEEIEIKFTSNFTNNKVYRIMYKSNSGRVVGSGAKAAYLRNIKVFDFWKKVNRKYGNPDNKDEVIWGLGNNKPYLKAATGFLLLEDPMLRELDYTRMSREDQRFMNTDLYSF